MRVFADCCLAALLFSPILFAAKIEVSGPVGSSAFGSSVFVVKHGNVVVLDPGWPNGQNFGAVRLYSPEGSLLSSLEGDSKRRVGHAGVLVLGDGNFVLLSSAAEFPACAYYERGAATWVDVDAGLPGSLTETNSVTCLNADEPDEMRALSLSNGNFVVQSDFEAVWGSAATGLPVGKVDLSHAFRTIPDSKIVALANDNYVVVSPGMAPSGAVTLGNGMTGLTGTPSASNSLVGSSSMDLVGYGGITELSSGDFVVSSPYWDNAGQADAGAVTWVDGMSGIAGAISASNSLVGVSKDDRVGKVYALANGNYVVQSRDWDDWTNGQIQAGAVTWGNGKQPGGTKGAVSPANSLVGQTYGNVAGYAGVKVLANGNYVVESVSNYLPYTYAATWADGAKALVGTITPSNSLIGSSKYATITPLKNGNFVFSDTGWVQPDWLNNDDNPPQAKAHKVGAVMWVDGTKGAIGSIDPTRSLLGNGYGSPGYLGGSLEGVTALDDGNYVVCDSTFQTDGKAGTPNSVGAVTWGDGLNGTTGVISAANSLVGSSANDNVCYMGSSPYKAAILALPGGDYVVRSPQWSNGAAAKAGAVTWVAGGGPWSANITWGNSLVGTTTNEMVGSNVAPVVMLESGDYVLSNPKWNNAGTVPNAGSVTIGRAQGGSSGEIFPQNSMVGESMNDGVGSGGVLALGGPYYLVKSPFWHDAAGVAVGAITLGRADMDVAGAVPIERSVLGAVPNQGAAMSHAFDKVAARLVVGDPKGNRVTILDVGTAQLLRDGFED